jgi:hypothetical protein
MWNFNSVVQFLSSRLGCSISGFQLGALSGSGFIYDRMMMIWGSEPETINCMLGSLLVTVGLRGQAQ